LRINASTRPWTQLLLRRVSFTQIKNGPVSRAVGVAAAEAANYQITTFLSPPRTIVSPALHWKAVAKASMLDGAPIARSAAGACGSVFNRTSSASGRMLPRQIVAKFRKERWSGVKPSIGAD